MARPTSLHFLTTILYGLLAGVGAALLISESWRHPEEGIGVWFLLSIVVPVPAGLAIGVLVARLERAATGLRHPRRFWWVVASIAGMYLAHWAVFLLWLPIIVINGVIGPSHRWDNALEDSLYVAPSWVLAGIALGMLVFAVRALRRRSWEGVTSERRSKLPRTSTTVIAAGLYAACALVPALLISVLALEEGEVGIAIGGWLLIGALVITSIAAFATWVYRQLPHALGRNVSSLRFIELAGAFWVAHWGIPFLLAMLPMWDRGDGERILFALTVGIALVLGVGCWSAGRTWRMLPNEPAR